MSLHDRLPGRAALVRSPGGSPAMPADDCFGGREVSTPVGPAYCIELAPFPAASPGQPSLAHLWRRLQLVHGIGPVTEGRLWSEGYCSLHALASHPRWGRAARRVIQALKEGDLAALRLAGARDNELLAYFDSHDFVLVDIETTGLARALPLFLIGLAWYHEGTWRLCQLLARSFEEERAVLHLTLEALTARSALVSYNGRAFDEPYVQARLAFHRMARPHFRLHLDLYQEARRLQCPLPDRKLPTVVQHMLGLERGDDIPGYLVPELYFRYIKEARPELLYPVLQHNARDVADLCRLFDLLRCRAGDRATAPPSEVCCAEG